MSCLLSKYGKRNPKRITFNKSNNIFSADLTLLNCGSMDTKQANSVMFCCLVKGEPEIQGQEPGGNVIALIWKR